MEFSLGDVRDCVDDKGKTLAACLAFEDGPKFGHLPDFFSLFSPSPGFRSIFVSLISSPTTSKSIHNWICDGQGVPRPWSRGARRGVEMTVVPSVLFE